MFRLSGLLCMVLAVGCGSLLFWTSQSVQRAEHKLSQIERSNKSEQETLRVLSTEWDFLNRPERLENLTRYNVDMDEAYAVSDNFVEAVNEIPQPVIPALPKVKPVFFQKNLIVDEQNALPVIQKSEKESFEKLIKSVVDQEGKL